MDGGKEGGKEGVEGDERRDKCAKLYLCPYSQTLLALTTNISTSHRIFKCVFLFLPSYCRSLVTLSLDP